MKIILIIEDDPAIRAELNQLLTRPGYQINPAKTGLEALSRLAALWADGGKVPDLILGRMPPVKHGVSLYRSLKSSPLYRNVPLILLQGGEVEEGEVQGYYYRQQPPPPHHAANRQEQVFTYPFELGQVLAAVTTLLEPLDNN